MSQQNVELVRRHYEAFARGEVETALQMRDEQIEFRVAEHSVFDRGTPFRGRQEVTGRIFRRLGTEWDGFTVEPQILHDAGDVIVMQGRYGGTCKARGRSTKAQVVHVWTIRKGKLSQFQQYVDTAEMRAVVGLLAV
jgi:ketosteroid isomerase-like protein